MTSPLRLRLDGDALVANWQWLARTGRNAACGAAVKADAYGLGARDVTARLASAGCRDFFVATWDEAARLGPLPPACTLSVLHGVRDVDMAAAVAASTRVRPVLNTAAQVARWRPTGLPCDVMVDTGMNRLGLSANDLAQGMLDGMVVDTLMSHLACADEDTAQNAHQLAIFTALTKTTAARRYSLANSAGICLGPDYAFGLTRPGLGLYGGVSRREAAGHIAQVAFPEAQVVQRRRVATGDSIGYGGTFVAPRDTEVAIINCGYADGYLRSFAGRGTCGGGRFAVLGRVSMDLIAIDVGAQPDIAEDDWVTIDYALPAAAAASGLTQYELLTGLGGRFDRYWV